MAGISRRTEIIVNVIVCVGASIVLIGALTKLIHHPIADFMLTIGLLTEAGIFLVYAFLPPAPSGPAPVAVSATSGNPVILQIEEMFRQAGLNPTNLQRLATSFEKLNETTQNLVDVSDVVKSTGDFSANTKSAAEAMAQVTHSIEKTSDTLLKFNQASGYAEQFHGQVQSLTKNLASLNAIYEIELQDTNNHLKAMNSFFGNMTQVSQAMQGSAEDAKRTQEQIAILAKNLASLNTVYGNMLSAMQIRG
jgi:gliding motility-associated protein GldL